VDQAGGGIDHRASACGAVWDDDHYHYHYHYHDDSCTHDDHHYHDAVRRLMLQRTGFRSSTSGGAGSLSLQARVTV
jgi:hypothetical protein